MMVNHLYNLAFTMMLKLTWPLSIGCTIGYSLMRMYGTPGLHGYTINNQALLSSMLQKSSQPMLSNSGVRSESQKKALDVASEIKARKNQWGAGVHTIYPWKTQKEIRQVLTRSEPTDSAMRTLTIFKKASLAKEAHTRKQSLTRCYLWIKIKATFSIYT